MAETRDAWLAVRHTGWRVPPASLRRWMLAAVLVSGLGVGFGLTADGDAARALASAGPELARLLKAMIALKALMAAAAVAAIGLRLGRPSTGPRLVLYLGATGAMAVGLGLMWRLADLTPGGALFHVGLVTGIVVLWRDPVVAGLLRERLARAAR